MWVLRGEESTPHSMDIVKSGFISSGTGLCKEDISRKIQKRDSKCSGSLGNEDTSVGEEPYCLQTEDFNPLCSHYPLGILSL